MPSYFYHLQFELYPSPPSDLRVDRKVWSSGDNPIWLPAKHTSIFDELPSHPREPSSTPTNNRRQLPQIQSRELTVTAHTSHGNSVIDCGTPRPPSPRDERNIVILSKAQQQQRKLSFPALQPSAAINTHTAVKDWRFGQISIESIDIDGHDSNNDTMEETPTSTSAAATVGPSMGNAGKATKAKYVPLATAKNTNIGWGIVHLYREGKESPELRLPAQEDWTREQDEAQVDCTTVCIPAVPSYLSPSDFLGFIGDKWRDQISHYRMIMTGWMNRYLVLMKFRDSKKSRLFKKEFDGRVFNPILV